MKRNFRILRYCLLSIIFLAQFTWAAAFIPQNSNREVLNFNTNWKWFNYDVVNGQDPALNESGAQDVSLPHSNAILDLFDVDPSEWRYISWYRRHFSLSSTYNGRRVFVEFQGAGQVNQVYVNGSFVGESKGHFTSFKFDITDYITYGNYDNVIAVRVDNTAHTELPPTGGDFYYFGGIHRDVKMIITDSLYVEDAFVWTEKNGTGIDVKAKVKVVNKYAASQSCTVTTNLVDAGNNVTASSTSQTQNIAANSSYEFTLTQYVANPHLWTLADPYLHTVRTQVQKGLTYVDDHSVTTGLRWVRFDPKGTNDAKFYLNDQPLRLFGVNRHEQYPYVGNAGANRFHRRDAQILKYEAGCNVIRTSHYPVDPEFLDECDKIGLLVEEENFGWGTIGDAAWKAAFETQLQTMIMRDRNHPAIFMWSVCVNEGPLDQGAWDNGLHSIAKGLDPTRPTGDETNKNKEFVTDVYCYHDYSGDGIITPYNQPWVVGEWNNALGTNFVVPNDNETRKINMLEKDTLKLNNLWASTKVAGVYRWDSFGYLTPQNVEPIGSYGAFKNVAEYRCSGMFGRYREPRWLAYMYQSQAEPSQVGEVVQILSEWKSDSSSTVYVASNCEQVELFKGATSLGKISPNAYTSLAHGLFKWTGVTWSAGSTLVAKGYRSGAVVVQSTRYASSYGGGSSLVLTSKTGNSITADGSDLAWIEAKINDSNGQRCFYEDGNLFINSLTGPGDRISKTNPIQMTDGLSVFLIKSKLNQTGTVRCQAQVDLGVSVNDSVTGTGQNQFEFSPAGNWSRSNTSQCYNGDETWSNTSRTSNDYCQVRFTGVQIRLYGTKAPNYGKAAISIDGGAETTIDCYALQDRRRENLLLYTSPFLAYGAHTLKVRVKLEKHTDSTGYCINVDRVKVMDGTYDLTSSEITINSNSMTDVIVPLSSGNTPTPTPSATPTPTPTPGATPLFSDNFEDGDSIGWTVVTGTWSVVTDGSKMYKQTTSAGGSSYAGTGSWANYTVDAKLKPLTFGSGGCVSLSFRFTDNNNRYFVMLDGANKIEIKKAVGGAQSVLETKAYTISAGTVYQVKVVVNGSAIDFYVNGTKELTAADTSFASGKIALNMYQATGEYDDIVVTN
jgi:beta-galactosidase